MAPAVIYQIHYFVKGNDGGFCVEGEPEEKPNGCFAEGGLGRYEHCRSKVRRVDQAEAARVLEKIRTDVNDFAAKMSMR
ncbi:MAG: hypothetical protein Q7R83_01095 [bacterium]|nr:hypothetical protein [bacterium]